MPMLIASLRTATASTTVTHEVYYTPFTSWSPVRHGALLIVVSDEFIRNIRQESRSVVVE